MGKLRVNMGKTKVIGPSRNVNAGVIRFECLCVHVAKRGTVKIEVRHRVNERCLVMGALKGMTWITPSVLG